MYFQDVIMTLQKYWAEQGCVIEQPSGVECGAGTFNPNTFLRVIGPEPWRVAYVEPSRRPTDGRYGENPNRLQRYFQFQVILKPSPDNVQELYLQSLNALGIDPAAHDIRFVEDDWESHTLGAWGLGWEVWLDGMEVSQFTYFQQVGGIDLMPVSVELTYGLERLAMYLQGVESVYDLRWNRDITYGDIYHQNEVEQSRHNFEASNAEMLLTQFGDFERECGKMLELGLPWPAYDYCLKCSHTFNLLDARGAISITERTGYIGRVRALASGVAQSYARQREEQGHPLLAHASKDKCDFVRPGSASEPKTAPGETATFLLEIGTEELPSRFLHGEEKELAELFEKALKEAALPFGEIDTMATPRRLVLLVRSLAPMQDSREEIITGPPARIAFDADGKPSKALVGFAKTCGVAVSDVFEQQTPRGSYMAARKVTGGKSAMAILAEICPRIIHELSFAKRMRWGAHDIAYARPIRWIVALLNGDIVHFNVGPVQSGRHTWGHRVLGAGPYEISDIAGYPEIMNGKAQVCLDPVQRRQTIIAGGDSAARAKGGSVIWKDDLLSEVCGLVEQPVPLLGDFDPSFLEIPAEVLLTSMESHQKSFGIKGPDGRLMPHFLTVLNVIPTDMATVKKGWEKVLRARLEDARFFWNADGAQNMQDWVAKLDNVIFIGPLGSMGDKGRRLQKLCAWIANMLNPPFDATLATRAGELAKADLVSGMVGEFDTLQGIMGGIYAARAGENEEVAGAIGEQYLPAGPDSPLPQTLLGAILSIADKADTLAGCFGINMIPTGAADPNGLRRCALGIIRILIDRNMEIRIGDLFAKARELYGEKRWKLTPEQAKVKLLEFFAGRMRNYFLGLGYDTVLVDATLAAGFERVPDCKNRLDAMTAFAAHPAFPSSVQTLKRVENIAKKAGASAIGGDWDEALLKDDQEKELAAALAVLLPRLDKALDGGDYAGAFACLEEMRQPVDAFFDNVMVMCDDKSLRENRLGLLNSISRRFARIAQFSALQI